MRVLASLLATALGFLLANRAVVALAPWPKEVGLRAKMEHLEAHADAYDAVFVGSSATFYGLVPEEFEARLAERGIDLEVFNLGVGGMGSYEAQYLLRRLLDRRPERLRYVFYEEPLFDPRLWLPDVFNPRYVHWHDLRTTLAALREVRRVEPPADADPGWRRGLAVDHALLFLRRETALGAGRAIVRSLAGADEDEVLPPPEVVAEGRGWLDIAAEASPGARRAHERFLADPDAYAAKVEEARRVNEMRPEPEEAFDLPELERLIADVRAAGAEPVFYVAPRGLGNGAIHALHEAGHLPNLLAFHHPGEHPALWAAEHHWDASHLTAEGARLWSRAFADAFADALESGAIPRVPPRGEGE